MKFDEYGQPLVVQHVVWKRLTTSSAMHFSMWALLKSPLMMGHDLLNMVCFVSRAK